MAKAKKKRGKRKVKGQNSGPILLNERRDKIIRLVKKGFFHKAFLQIDSLKESLVGNPDLLSKISNYIAKKIIAYSKKTNILENAAELCNHGTVLLKLNQYEAAIENYEQALNINPPYINALVNCGVALGELGCHEAAIEKYEQTLNINPNDIETLSNYGSELGKLGKHEKAIEKFERALKIKPNHYGALINYGVTLVYSGQYHEAAKKLEKARTIAPDEPATLFLHAMLLQREGKYDDAISALLKIDQNTLSSYNANVLYMSLGRLYYLIRSEKEGDRYFELAIEQSEDKDAGRINVARHIFADNPYSQEGVDILLEIAENSPKYAEAFKILTLNLSLKDYYRMFYTHSEAALHDTEMLNRSIYHKITNEISILKGIAYRILYRSQAKDDILSEIIESIEDIIEQISIRRGQGKRTAKAIPDNDYEKLMQIISETAHDISDFVNNEMAVIESRIRRVMLRMPKEDSRYPQFEGLLEQLEFTQIALNDLKTINEGIRIRRRYFRVKKLFEKWEKNRNIANARIDLDIQNGDTTFNGDEEKIKSMLNELVENSLKHNSGQANLEIRITAKDTTKMPPIRDNSIPGQQRYLFIEFRDNGQGIAKNRKHRIFLPLETTSAEGEGSGLGLFIIKKTLNQMNGSIRESGKNGARFKIYIPYPGKEENEYIEGDQQYSFAVG